MSLNAFRVVADVSHTVSKGILIFAIHANRSAEGVSLITQALYAVVFSTRYIDLFWTNPFYNEYHPAIRIWNFILKIFYILSSFYIIFIMMRIYGRTHEREKAWKFGYACLGGSLVLAPFTMLLWTDREKWSFVEYLWNSSEILESVCILPQLLLLRQTSVPTVIDSFYLLTLGSYRFFYILNWILLGTQQITPPIVSIVFGVIQTAFYIDFAWVYYSRQRVKLRNGALVDSDDFRKGWIVSRILGKAGFSEADYDSPADGGRHGHQQRSAEEGFGAEYNDDGDAEGDVDNAPAAPRPKRVGSMGGWGKRGISVSADEDLDMGPPPPAKDTKSAGPNQNAKATSAEAAGARPEERAGMLNAGVDDDDEELGDDEEVARRHGDGLGGGSEWN